MQGIVSDLIKAVEEERIKRKLDHKAFSALLGIDESYWHRIRTGERPLNLNILQIFMQKLPEVTPEVTNFVVNQGNNDNQKAENDPEKPSPKNCFENPPENKGGKDKGDT